MNLFEKNVLSTIKKYNMISDGDKIVVGLSGGADSSALLRALKNLSSELNISLIASHLNHGIRGNEAERDLEFSKSLSQKLGILFVSKSVSVPDYCKEHKMSEEMAGRELRYAFFDEICKKYGCNKIAVAHNKNDKAETILINILRGSGAAGLGGIPEINGKIIRPLIETFRADIENYVSDIPFVTDSTNNENIYTRNIIRNEIIPKMKCINSAALNNIIRCSSILKSEDDFLNSYTDGLNALSKTDCGICISRSVFSSLHIALKRRLIIKAVKLLCGTAENISSAQTDLIINGLKTGNVFYLHNTVITVENESILVCPFDEDVSFYEYFLEIPGKITVSETNITYTFEVVSAKDDNCMCLNYDKLKGKKILLRTRTDGDTFAPSGMSGTKKIKKFYIDNKIPKRKRNLYPLLVADGETTAVLPLRVSRNYIIDDTTQNILRITISGGSDVKQRNM